MAAIPDSTEIEAIVRRLLDEYLAPIRRALPPSLVSIDEAARILGVSPCTVRRRIKAGEIVPTRIGRAIRIDAAALRPPTEAEVIDLAARARGR